MPYGAGSAIRVALLHAKPWQRCLIGVGMLAGGIVLVLVGHVAGAVLGVAGVVLLWRMLEGWIRHRRKPTRSGGDATRGASDRT